MFTLFAPRKAVSGLAALAASCLMFAAAVLPLSATHAVVPTVTVSR